MPLPFRRAPQIAALGLLCFAGLAAAAPAADAPVRIPLDAMNGSGESGVTILTPQGGKTLVELQMKGGKGDPQPAHFHTGTCDKYAPRPLYPLRSVVKGESVTTLDVPIDKLIAGDLVVNVHKSFDDIATIASCAVAKPK
ncbi:MAG TPA: hypothetical protein VFF00_01480 [Candidatus Elarobacter sp.]|nr:hypothetical protein [Dongiaceae bacterium]HZW52669.1 hypothetical protein [Candidatus Elarobacter sp.]